MTDEEKLLSACANAKELEELVKGMVIHGILELIADRDRWKAKYVDEGLAKSEAIRELIADRDKWKARAEALERFLLHSDLSMCEGCTHCNNNDPDHKGISSCDYKGLCENYSGWLFDEARFKEGAE